jgi:hypothetical protein
MYSNQNRKNHNIKYSSNLIDRTTYCCQSPNTCVIPNRTQADKELLKQFYEANGYDQKEMNCQVCKNVNLLN